MWVSQTHPSEWEEAGNGINFDDGDEYFDVFPGEVVDVTVKFLNTGTKAWYNDAPDRQVCINIYKDPKVKSAPDSAYDTLGTGKYGTSYFENDDWINSNRIACIKESIVNPGEEGTLEISFKIPEDAPSGIFREDISFASGAYWIAANAPFNMTDSKGRAGTGDPFGVAHIWIGFHVYGYFEEATVSKVIDGDTVKLQDGRIIRYLGIDTPESVHPSVPDQCYGDEASDKNKELVLNKKVILFGDLRLIILINMGDILEI